MEIWQNVQLFVKIFFTPGPKTLLTEFERLCKMYMNGGKFYINEFACGSQNENFIQS